MLKFKVIMKKSCLVALNLFFVSSLSISNVKALEESNIPDYMAPNTIIEYINDKDYRIIQGGEYNGTPPYDNSYIQRIKDRLNVSESDIVKMEKPCANEGTKVYYNDDGSLKDIQIKLNISTCASNICPKCKSPYLKRGKKLDPNQWFQWGGKNGNDNFLEVNSSGQVNGYGRFTNFTSTKGELGNVLKKGDVATRYHVDNPAYGIKLKCVANGHTKTMIKRDVGCLPNAVLDIWKYGVEYFGKNWSVNVSINDAHYGY